MKSRCRNYNLEIDPRFAIEYGSVVNRFVTSFYIQLCTWIDTTSKPPQVQLSNVTKRIKQGIYNSLPEQGLIKKDMVLVTPDLPQQGLKASRTFVGWEITCYLNDMIDIMQPIAAQQSELIMKEVIKVLDGVEGFTYHLRKKDKNILAV